MNKFAVVSGFLGAGKTSVMMALTAYDTARGLPAAMISNDLGEGVTLADHRLAALSGVNASEITGECICFCHDVLRASLAAHFDAGCALVLSDIPGFGVGALEHVYHGLAAEGLTDFALAPFTVVIEPEKAALLQAGRGGDMAHILRAQLMEADCIVLNKRDLLTDAELAALTQYLAGAFPGTQVLAVSARTGAGLDALSDALRAGTASMRHPAIDYEGDDLQNAMARLSEYYLQYHAVVCCDDFDGTAYLLDIAEKARAAVRAAGGELPHLKLLAWGPEGDFGKMDVLGVGRAIEVTRPFAERCTDIAVVLNASAACPAAVLDAAVTTAAEDASREYQLDMAVFRKDCFGMGG